MRKQRRLRTAWELPELIRRQPQRQRGKGTVKEQPWHPRIVAFTHLLRFVTASMLQRQFPQWLTSERTAQRHLATLVERGYLATADPWAVGRNFPYVYHATPAGLRFVNRMLGEIAGVEASPAEEKRTRGYGLHSLLHELFVSEFTINLTRTVGEREDVRLLDLERRYFRKQRRLTYSENGETKTIEPDLGFWPAMRGASSTWSPLPMHFVEMENGTHSMQEIGEKLRAYERWAATEGDEHLAAECRRRGASMDRPEFRLLLVCHDKYGARGDDHVLADWMIQAMEFPRRMRSRIWLCSTDKFRAARPANGGLDGPVWIRANDARRWLAEYRRYVRHRTDTRASRSFTRHRKFVKSVLQNMRRHSLLPE